MPSSKPKPSEVAAAAKKNFIPHIKSFYAEYSPTESYHFQQPMLELALSASHVPVLNPHPPVFYVRSGDPVDATTRWAQPQQQNYLSSHTLRIPFICVANDKRPGGDWETGAAGYEERLCRRSNLSAALSSPANLTAGTPFSITSEGAIYSQSVVVFRGPHEQYVELDERQWTSLPIISLPAVRWPKLVAGGTKYAFPDLEREMVKNKIRGALQICVCYGHQYVVIGDWGLGGNKNPPRELAEIWREVFLYDPDIRGKFQEVAFVFEDTMTSTTRLIVDEINKQKNKTSGGSSGSSKSKGKAKGHNSTSASGQFPTDFQIFNEVFAHEEIHNVMARPNPQLSISNMLTQY